MAKFEADLPLAVRLGTALMAPKQPGTGGVKAHDQMKVWDTSGADHFTPVYFASAISHPSVYTPTLHPRRLAPVASRPPSSLDTFSRSPPHSPATVFRARMATPRCTSRLAGNGSISRDEFAHGIEAYGIQAKSREEVDALFSIIDTDGGGSIDLNELKQGLKRLEVRRQFLALTTAGFQPMPMLEPRACSLFSTVPEPAHALDLFKLHATSSNLQSLRLVWPPMIPMRKLRSDLPTPATTCPAAARPVSPPPHPPHPTLTPCLPPYFTLPMPLVAPASTCAHVCYMFADRRNIRKRIERRRSCARWPPNGERKRAR